MVPFVLEPLTTPACFNSDFLWQKGVGWVEGEINKERKESMILGYPQQKFTTWTYMTMAQTSAIQTTDTATGWKFSQNPPSTHTEIFTDRHW